MAATNKMYLKLTSNIKNYDELEISVGYEKGGINYFNGTENKRGIYVYIKPVHRGQMSVSCLLLGNTYTCGYKFIVCETARKNSRKEDMIFSAIEADESLKIEIPKLYMMQDYQCITSKIRNAVSNITK